MAEAATGADVAVVGGGLVGSALAWGFARAGAAVALFDADADRFHASGGNFGLVWVQGKGAGAPAYAALSRRSAELWGDFAAELADRTGVAIDHTRTGGLKVALDEAEYERFATAIRRMHNQPPPGANDARMLDAREARDLLPALGPEVRGAAYGPHDGYADPLATLHALRTALAGHAGVAVERAAVTGIDALPAGGFRLATAGASVTAERVVLAAGLANAELAPRVGLDAPLRPERGQILVSERLEPFLAMATHTVRQTGDGTVLMGDSKEDVGFDTGTTAEVRRAIVGRAVRTFPRLANARLVRQWAALRVLAPDGLPIYQESPHAPGAFLVTCHSGVTLAAVHALELAPSLLAGRLAADYAPFALDRLERMAS
ncbi:MAG: NAD(P)/FAD-dependent oxidoreductase [Alphaproteobacteria bacterium]